MTKITFQGEALKTIGSLPNRGSQAPEFTLVKSDLSELSLKDMKGKKVLLNIFPSIDTGVCAMSVKEFNERASNLSNVEVVCVSKDLPFAQSRFCGAEGIDKVITASDFRGSFGKDYGLIIEQGALAGLHSRCVVVLDEEGKVIYTEQVSEITNEPNYDAAIEVISS